MSLTSNWMSFTSTTGTTLTNPTYILADDANYGTVGGVYPSPPVHAYIYIYGISNPSEILGAHIIGVEVDVKGYYTTSGTGGGLIPAGSQLIIAGTPTGTAQGAPSPNLQLTEGYVSLGSSSSLWGTTLTYEQAIASNFGVYIPVDAIPGSASGGDYINYVRIRFTYEQRGLLFI